MPCHKEENTLMNYCFFLEQLKSRVSGLVGDEYHVEIQSVRRNNGVMQDCLLIRRPNDMICPNMYLDRFYEQYCEGASIEVVANKLVELYRRAMPGDMIDPEELFNSRTLKERVVYRLINYERNMAFLEKVPHKRFLDLALIYVVIVKNNIIGNGAIQVRQDALERFGITLPELDKAAGENTNRLMPADFLSITSLLQEFGREACVCSYPDLELEEESSIAPMYVLTNKERQYGACYMTDMEILDRISRELKDDLYLLPSSVHECMIVPAGVWDEPENLSDMVKEINSTQVAEDEFLGNSVYRFRKETKEVCIAA